METGTVTVEGGLVQPAIVVSSLEDERVLLCVFLPGGPTMIYAVRGLTPGPLVFVPA